MSASTAPSPRRWHYLPEGPHSSLGLFNIILIIFFPFLASGAAGMSVSILKVSEDETFEIGTPKVGIKNYPAGFEWVWFLIAPEGRQVQLAFETFELEQSTDCENDYLEVREAVTVNPEFPTVSFDGEFGPILSKPVCGTNKPTTILSSGNKMWVHFKSDSNISTTYKGFKASFKAGVYDNHIVTLYYWGVAKSLFTY